MLNVLDLHGIKHEEVPKLMDNFLYYHMMNNSIEIKIITGNSEKMKNIVKNHLNEYDIKCHTSFFSNAILIANI